MASSAGATSFESFPFLKDLGLKESENGCYDGRWGGSGAWNTQYNPATGEVIGRVRFGTKADYEAAVSAMEAAKEKWASTPAPLRGEVVRKIGERLRQNQAALGKLVSLEMGKILAEGVGEVQEAVDICDFAVGLSRSLNGAVIPSERPAHFMMERWNPLKANFSSFLSSLLYGFYQIGCSLHRAQPGSFLYIIPRHCSLIAK
ncbi:unnamed protein product [Phaeothamnion confervicola]